MESKNLTAVLQSVVVIKNEIEKFRNGGILKDSDLVPITDSIVAIKKSIIDLQAEIQEVEGKYLCCENEKITLAKDAGIVEERLAELTTELENFEELKTRYEAIEKENRTNKVAINLLKEQLSSNQNSICGDEAKFSELKLILKEMMAKVDTSNKQDKIISEEINKMKDTLTDTNRNTKSAVNVLKDYNRVIERSQGQVEKILDDNSKTQIMYEEGIKECKDVIKSAELLKEELDTTREDIKMNKESIEQMNKTVKEHTNIMQRLKRLFK